MWFDQPNESKSKLNDFYNIKNKELKVKFVADLHKF